MLQRVRAPLRSAVLALAVLSCAPSRAARPRPSQVGQRLELVATGLDGREHDVGAEQGKVRVVDFWASWCEPCRDAMPHLDRLSDELGPRGLAVYGVSFDEDRSQVDAFLMETPVKFRVLWDKGGDRWSARYEVTRLPTTFVVDRRGVIRAVHAGWTASKAAEARREVERLLDEAP